MKFESKYRLMLHKSYFDKGNSMLSVIKYAFAAIFLLDYGTGIISLMFYGVLAYTIGRVFYKYGWLTAEIEVGNRYNRFVKEMRATYKKR